MFTLDVELSLNLTVLELIIPLQGVFDCLRSSLIFHQPQGFENRYCSCNPKFHFYFAPSNTKIEYRFILGRHILKLSAFFTIMDRNLAESYNVPVSHPLIKKNLMMLLLSDFGVLHYFRLTAPKICKIYLFFTESPDIEQTVLDGPGFYSKSLKPVQNIYKTSTFQCMTVLFSATHKFNFSQKNFQFVSKPVNKFESLIIPTNQSVSLELPQKNLDTNVYHINILTESHFVNVSVQALEFSGQQSFTCDYGGLCATEKLEKSFGAEVYLCESQEVGKNLYYKSSSLILSFYWYHHYSRIKVLLNLSTTLCQPMQIDPCFVQKFCENQYSAKCDPYLSQLSHASHTQLFFNALVTNNEVQKDVVFSIGDNSCSVIQLSQSQRNVAENIESCSIGLMSEGIKEYSRKVTYILQGSFLPTFVATESLQTLNGCYFLFETVSPLHTKGRPIGKQVSHFSDGKIFIMTEYFSPTFRGMFHLRHVLFVGASKSWVDVIVSQQYDNSGARYRNLKETFHFDTKTQKNNLYSGNVIGTKDTLVFQMSGNASHDNRMKLAINIASYTTKKIEEENVLLWDKSQEFSHKNFFYKVLIPGVYKQLKIEAEQLSVVTSHTTDALWIQNGLEISSNSVPPSPETCNLSTSIKYSSCELYMNLTVFTGQAPDFRFSIFNDFHQRMQAEKLYFFSWYDATRLCEEVDGQLPTLHSREELDVLSDVWKNSEGYFLIEAIYISLYFVGRSQVCFLTAKLFFT